MKIRSNKYAIAASAIVASYTLLRPLKIALFVETFSLDLLPWATIVSLLISYGITTARKTQASAQGYSRSAPWYLTRYTALLTFSSGILFLFPCKPVIWIWYHIADAHTVLCLQTFWLAAYVRHERFQLPFWQHRYITWGNIGSMLGLTLGWILQSHSTALILISISLLILASMALYRGNYAPYASAVAAETSPAATHYSSFLVVTMFILGLGYSFELLRYMLDYLLITQAHATHKNIYTTFLGATSLVQIISTLIILSIARLRHKKMAAQTHLVVTGAGMGLLAISGGMYPTSSILLTASIILQTLYAAIGYPAKQALYTELPHQTRVTVKFLAHVGKYAARSFGAALLFLPFTGTATSRMTLCLMGLMLTCIALFISFVRKIGLPFSSK